MESTAGKNINKPVTETLDCQTSTTKFYLNLTKLQTCTHTKGDSVFKYNHTLVQ